MELSDMHRMKEREQENNRLKRMFADLSLENTALKDLIEKSAECSYEKKSRFDLHESYRISLRTACSTFKLSRSVYRYKSKPKDDRPLIDGLLALLE